MISSTADVPRTILGVLRCVPLDAAPKLRRGHEDSARQTLGLGNLAKACSTGFQRAAGFSAGHACLQVF